MNKNRKVFTFPEKYGHDDVYEEACQIVADNWRVNSEELFSKIPHIGYLRVEVTSDLGNWWYDSNDDWIQAKVVRVNDETVDIFHYDSHHNQVVCLQTKFEGFQIRGNVLEKK